MSDQLLEIGAVTLTSCCGKDHQLEIQLNISNQYTRLTRSQVGTIAKTLLKWLEKQKKEGK